MLVKRFIRRARFRISTLLWAIVVVALGLSTLIQRQEIQELQEDLSLRTAQLKQLREDFDKLRIERVLDKIETGAANTEDPIHTLMERYRADANFKGHSERQ